MGIFLLLTEVLSIPGITLGGVMIFLDKVMSGMDIATALLMATGIGALSGIAVYALKKAVLYYIKTFGLRLAAAYVYKF